MIKRKEMGRNEEDLLGEKLIVYLICLFCILGGVGENSHIKPAYDEKSKHFFEQSIRTIVPNENNVDMAMHLKKFEDHAVEMERKIAEEKRKEEEEKQRRIQERREATIAKSRSQQEFLHQFEENDEKWKQNQVDFYFKWGYKERNWESSEKTFVLNNE